MNKNKSNAKRDNCIMPFRFVLSGTMTSGLSSFAASPAGLSPRMLTEADAWAVYRLKQLRFRLRRGSDTAAQAAGYVSGVPNTIPANLNSVTELINSTYLAPSDTRPSDWVNVRKDDLRGQFPWYKTISGTEVADITEPGVICIVGPTATGAWNLEIEGVIEFKDSVATANTPMELELRRKLRELRLKEAQDKERVRLLSALAPTAKGGPKFPGEGGSSTS